MRETVIVVDGEGGASIAAAGEVITTPSGEQVQIYHMGDYYHSLRDAIRQHVDDQYGEAEDQLDPKTSCAQCRGTGYVYSGDPDLAEYGAPAKGFVRCRGCLGTGRADALCQTCHGTGGCSDDYGFNPCRACHGTGLA